MQNKLKIVSLMFKTISMPLKTVTMPLITITKQEYATHEKNSKIDA